MSVQPRNDPDDPFDLRQSAIEWQNRELEPLLSASEGHEPPFDAIAAWERVSPRLIRSRQPTPPRWRRALIGGLGVAATFTVMVTYRATQEPTSLLRTTAVGEVDSTQLNDGSTVVLDGRSRIETGPTFGARVRDVRLQGRAHFRVAHDSKRPFRVFAGDMVAEALGTAFTVAEDPLRHEVEVVVTEGRVAFVPRGGDATRVELRAGDRATHRRGATVVERISTTALHTSWMSGDRRVAALPLRRVLPQLGRWFGLSVVVSDSVLLDRRLTVDWRHTSATGALTELAVISDAEVVQRGDTIHLLARRDRGANVR